jgi:hypothetical protein
VELVVARGSAAVGLRPDAGFRAAYGGSVVAVHRHGVPLLALDSVALEAGDALLLLIPDALLPKCARDQAFARARLVTGYRPRRSRAPLLGAGLVVALAVQALSEPVQGDAASLLRAALYGATATAVTSCASGRWS